MDTREIVLASIVPASASLLLLVPTHALLARRAARTGRPAPTLSWMIPPLLAAGVALGAWAWQSRLDLWPDSVTQRFPAIALAALLAGLLSTLSPMGRRPLIAAIPATLAGALVAWAVLGPLHPNVISEPARWGWIAGLALIAGAAAWSFEAGAEHMPTWRAPALLWLLFGLTALGATAGFANAPLILWPVAAVCSALALAGLFRPDANILRGVGPTLAVLLVGTITFSNWFADRERWLMFVLLASAPLGFALAALPSLRSRRPILRLAVVGVAALTPPAIQAAIALPELIQASSGSYDYDY